MVLHNLPLLEFLLKRGAPPNSGSIPPLQFPTSDARAIDGEADPNLRVAMMLMRYGASASQPLPNVVRWYADFCVRVLLAHGAVIPSNCMQLSMNHVKPSPEAGPSRVGTMLAAIWSDASPP